MRKTLETSTLLTGGLVNQYVDLQDLKDTARREAAAQGRVVVGEPRLSVRTMNLDGEEYPMLAAEWDTEEAA